MKSVQERFHWSAPVFPATTDLIARLSPTVGRLLEFERKSRCGAVGGKTLYTVEPLSGTSNIIRQKEHINEHA